MAEGMDSIIRDNPNNLSGIDKRKYKQMRRIAVYLSLLCRTRQCVPVRYERFERRL